MFKVKVLLDLHTNATVLIIKYCTNATTGTYLHQKNKNLSPESILEIRKSALIKDWESRIRKTRASKCGLLQKQLVGPGRKSPGNLAISSII